MGSIFKPIWLKVPLHEDRAPLGERARSESGNEIDTGIAPTQSIHPESMAKETAIQLAFSSRPTKRALR
jgi:hypothetical protein